MLTHEELQKLAEHPQLIESGSQLREIVEHTKECPGCADLLSQAVSLDRDVIGLIRRGWKHLTISELKKLKNSGFNPQLKQWGSNQEWHLSVCKMCAERFGELARSTAGTRFRMLRLVLALSIFIVVSVPIGLWVMGDRDGGRSGAFRSAASIELLAPSDMASVGPWQEFRWQPLGAALEYSLIIEAVPGQAVVKIKTNVGFHLLTPAESSALRPDHLYRWSVQTADGAASEWRKFRFVASKRGQGFREFPELRRRKLEGQVADATPDELIGLRKRLEDVLAAQPEAISADRAWLLRMLGNVLYRQDLKDQAVAVYRDSVKAWESLSVPDELNYARSLINFASASQDVGMLQASLVASQKALTILGSGTSPDFDRYRATCLLNLGVLYRQLGMPEKAVEVYSQALDLDRRLGDDGAVADDLTDLGNLYVDEFGQANRGISILEEALKIQRSLTRGGSPRDSFADTLDSLATGYRFAHRTADALALYRDAVEEDRRRKNSTNRAQTLNSVGQIHLDDLRNPTAAIPWFRSSLDVARQGSGANPEAMWVSLDGLGRAALQMGDFADAEKYLEESIAAIESIAKPIEEGDVRRLFRSTRISPYHALTMLMAARQSMAGTFGAMERGKARTLLEMSSGRGKTLKLVSLAELQQSLSDGEIGLDYLFGDRDDPVLLFAVTKDRSAYFPLGKGQDIEREVNVAAKVIAAGGETPGGTISELILPKSLGDFARGRDIRHIVLSPDGPLHRLAFEALRAPWIASGTILSCCRVSIVPSLGWLSISKSRREAKRDGPVRALVIADPVVETANPCASSSRMTSAALARGVRFAELPLTSREADMVLAYAPGSVALRRQEASALRFEAARLHEFSLVHFATHAYSSGSLDTSFLLFGCRPEMDAITGTEVESMQLSPDLVVLSACDTGAGRPLVGEGVDSLAYAFLTAGARSVVANRLKVRDEDAVACMRAFYRDLSRGASVGESISRLKRRMARSGSQPDEARVSFFCLGDCDVKLTLKPGFWRRVADWFWSCG